MSLLRLLSAFALVAAPFALLACPPSGPKPVAPTPSTSTTTTETPTIIPSASGDASASPSGPSSGSPFGNNTGVKAPVFGTDPCNADADCAAVATCHSDKCVAAKNAGTMPAGTLCTMDCRGGTVDCGYNHCGCATSPAGTKRCALLPGPKP
jgi:hypothetical protein